MGLVGRPMLVAVVLVVVEVAVAVAVVQTTGDVETGETVDEIRSDLDLVSAQRQVTLRRVAVLSAEAHKELLGRKQKRQVATPTQDIIADVHIRTDIEVGAEAEMMSALTRMKPLTNHRHR
ncbi:unnamed protein product [Pieris brassicae]|uniref:Secreted protein n=1 Tax=Pieris brassicae TaxID=7116 RepID=A0A9P0TL95_PIEBR|nr:unnamed protein product [Pieris brassicae]